MNSIDDEKQALLDILIDNEFKDCVSHSNVQSYLSDLWNGRAAIIMRIGYPKKNSKGTLEFSYLTATLFS